jgi:hypothetical protein
VTTLFEAVENGGRDEARQRGVDVAVAVAVRLAAEEAQRAGEVEMVAMNLVCRRHRRRAAFRLCPKTMHISLPAAARQAGWQCRRTSRPLTCILPNADDIPVRSTRN